MITTEGKNVFFNGEQVHILGRSSFKFMGHLRWGNVDGAKNWIAHNQKLGINLLRVFGETEFWDGHQMFGSPPTITDVWDYNALSHGHRPTQVSDLNGKMLTDLFKLSHETGMAFEYVVDATMKHASPDIPWGTIGHCVRQTLRYMRVLQELYPKALVMVNTHNEWDAHSFGSWHANYGDISATELREKALREVNMQASRARRWKNGDAVQVSYTSPGPGWEPEQWPECTLIVDHGGRNDIEYDASPGPHHYDMKTLHPRRDGEWWKVCERIDQPGDIPTYFSESKMWVDPADSVRAQQWYRSGTAYTTDLTKYLYFMDDAIEKGIHFTIHDEKGMQTDSGWPRDLTVLENELLGSGPPPPPPPPPEDDFKVHISAPDSKGRRSIFIELLDWPAVVEGGSEDYVVKKVYDIDLGRVYDTYAGGSFIGLDQGDIGEFDVHIDVLNGPEGYQRSLHKEVATAFDSMDLKYHQGSGRYWKVTVIARVTAENKHLSDDVISKYRNGNRLTARPHFGAYLYSK
jgi:hypothetical protein